MKNVKKLGLTFPTKREVIKNTLLTAFVMCAGGTFLFFVDTLTMFLFAVNG